MDFLIDLDREDVRRRIARRQQRRRLFWLLGIIVIAIQGMAIALPWDDDQTTLTPSAQTHNSAVDADSGTLTAQPTRVALVTATQTATPPPPTPTITQTATQTPIATVTPTPTVPLTGRSKQESSRSFTLLLQPDLASEQVFEIAGTGEPGDRISISYRHSLIAQGEVDGEGRWHVEIPTAPLARGKNTLQIAGGDGGQPLAFTFSFVPWWLDAPLRLQGDLGEGYACAPTVLGMTLDYFHSQDPAHLAPPTVEIVRALKAQGFIDGYGADARMLVNLSISYGYSHSFFYREWSQAYVRQMLEAGVPVIANVRIGMSVDGYGHSVLVIGISPDGKRVMVNDPAEGMVEYEWQVFERSWSSFGPPARHGLVVKP